MFRPHKTLGRYKSPAGSNKIQLQQITKKQNLISRQLASSPLNRQQAEVGYHCVYLPSIYVLPNCTFSQTELDKSEKQSIRPKFVPNQQCQINKSQL